MLHLDRQWVGKRDRWWCVLSARPLGPVKFEDLPEATDVKVVADVMPAPCEWPETEVAALELTLYEHHKIHCCSKGLEALLLNPNHPLPTALHSWGNQCYGCACGCRGAFSEKRLNERGVYAVLLSLGSTIRHEGFSFPKCRHLHPSEVAVLSGARVINWDGCMRLGLAATGQMASPLQAVWVCAHVIDRISKFVQIPTVVSPQECLAELKSLVLQDCEMLWKRPEENPTSTVGENDQCSREHPKQLGLCEGPQLTPMVVQVGHLPSGVQMEITVAEGMFVQSLVNAEATFWDCPVEELACVDSQGNALPDLCPLTHNMQIWIGPAHEPVRKQIPQAVSSLDARNDVATEAVGIPPRDMDLPVDFGASRGQEKDEKVGHLGQLPQKIDHLIEKDASELVVSGDALGKLKKKGLLEIVTPQVFSKSALYGLRSQMICKADRLKVLANQEDIWGDDEIRFHLHRVATSASVMQDVHVWDPLMTTSLMKSLQGTLVDHAIVDTPETATIITAAVVEGHWIPLVWRRAKGQVCGFSIGIPTTHLLVVQNLHAWLCNQWKVPVTPFKAVNQHVPEFCGVVAISYVEHLLWATPLAGAGRSLIELHREYRSQFENAIGLVTQRPWVWGRGQERPDPVLLGLLRQHGVQAADAVNRAEQIVANLGKEAVKKALQGQRPWQDLKSVANQQVPPYQLIRPGELQAIVEARSKVETPLGSKRQKSKGLGKGKGRESHALAPDSLRLDPGIFMVGEGKPVSQISLGDIGPMAMGVVLSTLDQALPFISQNRQVSMGGLAIVVLNTMEVPSGLPLIAEPIRFPAVCAANAEPVLVQGLMFQLGNVPVRRAAKQDPVAMECIQTFVAKMVIFRDGVADWETVTKQPIKYIQHQFPCLVSCRDEECSIQCGKWHSGKDIHIDDPIMAVWNRQWLKGNFVNCPSEEATMFVVSIRVPVELELQLISKSGVGSIVVEPRELDGRQVSKAYHVVWLPNQSFAQAQVLRQTTEGAIGLARIGDKWGLRCRAEQAAKVHKLIKPSTEYLPSGTKMHYLIGPVPYGTVKQSVVQACKAIEWEVRPLHAIPAPRSVEGIMYKVQSVVGPPKQFITLQDGEAVITRCDQTNAKFPSHVPVVGSSASVQLVQQPINRGPQDVLQINDPWASWKSSPIKSDTSSSSTRVSVEQQVVDAVLARLPREVVEADQNMDGGDRVASLEAQVATLKEKQAEMQQTIVDHANTQTAQVMQLQSQFQAQHCQLEAAVADQGRQLQGLGTQFQMQMEKQQSQLDGMFQSQMSKLEDLLSKRSRHE